MTKVARCGCTNVFQDKRYGPGMRVHNTNKDDSLTCTSCAKGAHGRQAEWKKYRHRK